MVFTRTLLSDMFSVADNGANRALQMGMDEREEEPLQKSLKFNLHSRKEAYSSSLGLHFEEKSSLNTVLNSPSAEPKGDSKMGCRWVGWVIFAKQFCVLLLFTSTFQSDSALIMS